MRKLLIIIGFFISVNSIFSQNIFTFRGFEWGFSYNLVRSRINVQNILTGELELYYEINDMDRQYFYNYFIIEKAEVAGYNAKAIYLFSKNFYRNIENGMVKTYYRLYENNLLRNYIFEINNSFQNISTVFLDLTNKLKIVYGNPLINNNFTLNLYNRAMQNKENIIVSVFWELEETQIELQLNYKYYFGNINSSKDVWTIYIVYKDKVYFRLMEERQNQENNRRRESLDGL